MTKLSIIMPVYNEKSTVEEILQRILAVDLSDFNLSKEIIIVDDGSSDGTRKILETIVHCTHTHLRLAADFVGMPVVTRSIDSKNEVKVIYHEKNIGKGAAIRTGIANITGNIVIIQDADLEYDPQDYLKLIEPIISGKAEVVYGSRFCGKWTGFSLWSYLGNKFLTFLTNLLYNVKITDMETCYKAFKSEIIKRIKIESNRFDFEPEVTTKILKQGYHILEVPISYSGRKFKEGKKRMERWYHCFEMLIKI